MCVPIHLFIIVHIRHCWKHISIFCMSSARHLNQIFNALAFLNHFVRTKEKFSKWPSVYTSILYDILPDSQCLDENNFIAAHFDLNSSGDVHKWLQASSVTGVIGVWQRCFFIWRFGYYWIFLRDKELVGCQKFWKIV